MIYEFQDHPEESVDENDPRNWTREQQVNYVAQRKVSSFSRHKAKFPKDERT